MSNPSEKLLIAAANGNLINVIQELQNKANINATDLNGYAPIHCAVYNNKVEVVKYLVKNGANVLLKDTHAYVGFTPLHYASAFGSSDMVKALLLSSEKNIHCKNSTGQTPADVASNSEVKALLLLDEKTRNQVDVFVQESQPQQQQKTQEQSQQQQTQEQSQPQQQNVSSCCSTSKCCKAKKIGKLILFSITALVFFGLPAIHLFTTPFIFPYYIFPCGLIIWIAGLVKIKCKAMKNESFKEKKKFAVHFWTVACFNVVILLTNLTTSKLPWFVFVWVCTLIPLAIHKIIRRKAESKINTGIAIHGLFYGSFIITSFVFYCLVNIDTKSFLNFLLMFILPNGIWTAIFVAHVFIIKKKKCNFSITIQKDVEQQKVEEKQSLAKNDEIEVKVQKQENNNSTSTIYPQVL